MTRHIKIKAFTLIELATVVTIIGILAAIAVPNFLNAAIRAKIAKSMSEQELIVWGLESYFIDNDVYPQNATIGVTNPSDLVPLTMPVPYMSQLPYDVFLYPANVDKNQWIETERNGNPFYFYVNYLQIDGNRMPLAPFGDTGTANYVVYGMGPKFPNEINPLEPENFIEYTPSNGTISSGAIQTFGP